MVDLTKHIEGIEAVRNNLPTICRDPKTTFLNVLQSQGFTMPKVLKQGTIDRIKGPEDRGTKKSGWYVYHEIDDTQEDGMVIGFARYGDWKTGLSENWSSRSENRMSGAERLKYIAKRDAMREEQEQERLKFQQEAAERALKLWTSSPQASTHPYLDRKKVKAGKGVKIGNDGRLIVPIAVGGEITSLQFIDAGSGKRFLTGGKLKGGWFLLEGSYDTIYIAEGYSTAASIWEATGKTTFVAFNAGNLYEVCSYVKGQYANARIIIAGDDDTDGETNIGRRKAEQAAHGLGIEAVFPQGFNDFNDMHAELGLQAVKDLLIPQTIEPYEPKTKTISGIGGDIEAPSGVLGQIYDYYNVTSGNDQKGFAVQTALACCSLILGRLFKTDNKNWTSLYFINVGETATGKEHAKEVFEDVMMATGNGNLIAGDGYTSQGAVFSTLLDRPKHGICTDELGRYLEAAMGKSLGNNNQREANTALMEAFGRSHKIMRPKNYSSMTLKGKEAAIIKDRFVWNPSITWVGMTTPSTLFNAIDINAVTDGFINRFIISISEAEPTIRTRTPEVDVPDTIIQWAKRIKARNNFVQNSSEEAKAITIPISPEAHDLQIEFQKFLLKERKKLKKYGMDGLCGRSNEQAMRMSLIYTLSEDPEATIVPASAMEWSIKYVKRSLFQMTSKLKMVISHSEFEAHKKEILQDLRSRGKEGITWSEMMKTPPYSKHKPKYLREIMASLKDGDLAIDEVVITEGRGRNPVRWIALK